MQDENILINNLCTYLESASYTIERKVPAGIRGIDVVASHALLGHILIIEAKGETSSNPNSSRYGMAFDHSQVLDVVAKGFYETLQRRHAHGSNPMYKFAFACPDTPLFLKYLTPILSVAKLAGVVIFLVAEDGTVRQAQTPCP